MRNPVALIAVVVSLAASAQAQLAQPPAGVTEGLLKEQPNACPANPPLGKPGSVARLVGLGRSPTTPAFRPKPTPVLQRRTYPSSSSSGASDFPAPRACIHSPPSHSAESLWEATTVWCIRWTRRPAAFTGPTRPICLAGSLPSPHRSPAIPGPATRSCSSLAPPPPTLSMRRTASCFGKRKSGPDSIT